MVLFHKWCGEQDVTLEEYTTLVVDAANTLKAGNVIAVPTDTIYGIAALAQVLKGFVHISDMHMLK